MSSPVDLVLSRLEKPREVAPRRWRCRCPAHGGKGNNTLSVGVGHSNQVLLKCWAGCGVDQVAEALGLDLADLFPTPEQRVPPLERRRLLSAGQALDLLQDEANFVAVAACNLAQGVELFAADHDRLLRAAARIRVLFEETRT